MYTDISIEQRSHDLALQITTLIYQRDNLPLKSQPIILSLLVRTGLS